MTAYSRRHPLIVMLLYSSVLMKSSALRLRALATTLAARLESSRCRRITRQQVIAARSRESRESPYCPSKVERAAGLSWQPFNPFRID
jgi:hypothetical protein